MSCAFLAGEGVIFSVWGEPAVADIDNGMLCLDMIYEKTHAPILYITRVPSDAPAPDAKFRHYLHSKMPDITAKCDAYHVVLEGSGFVAALKRGILVSIFQIGQRRNTFFVHSSVDEIIEKVDPQRRAAVRSVLRTAEAQGLLHGAPVGNVA